jgi:hypothetical protein
VFLLPHPLFLLLSVMLRVCDFFDGGDRDKAEEVANGNEGGGAVMEEAVRLREPHRRQVILQAVDYDALIDAAHPARAIWRVLEGLDLRASVRRSRRG